MGDSPEARRDSYSSILGRGGLASSRLTTQHFILCKRQGWLLHPQVEEALESRPDFKIADIATGNGIWAVELSEKHPDAEIVGLDISSQQLPPDFTLPKNVRFGLYNIFDPVPQEYQGYFDVVHIRLLVAAIYHKDKDTLLSNLATMLKPGGYIQWDELVYPTTLAVDSSFNVDSSLRPFYERMDRVTGVLEALRWAATLPEALEQKGWVAVHRHDPPLHKKMLQHESDCMVWSLNEIIETIRNSGLKGAHEEMDKALEELNKEIEDGFVYAYSWEVVIARKPTAA